MPATSHSAFDYVNFHRCYHQQMCTATHMYICHTHIHAAGKSSSRDTLSENKLMAFSFTLLQSRPCTLLCWKPDWWALCHLNAPSNICVDFPCMLSQHTAERQPHGDIVTCILTHVRMRVDLYKAYYYGFNRFRDFEVICGFMISHIHNAHVSDV